MPFADVNIWFGCAQHQLFQKRALSDGWWALKVSKGRCRLTCKCGVYDPRELGDGEASVMASLETPEAINWWAKGTAAQAVLHLYLI